MAERRYSLVFYAAVLVAAAATYGVYLMLQRTREANRVATAPVVVALKDMPEGATIDRTSIATMHGRCRRSPPVRSPRRIPWLAV